MTSSSQRADAEMGPAAGKIAKRRIRWWLAAVAGLAALAALWAFLRRPAEPLTRESLREAHALWSQHGPSSYVMEIHVSGAQKGEHHIEVHNGEVVNMTTGGQPVGEAAWKYWTVEGLFGFLETELYNAAHPERAYGVPDSSQVVLRARFHSQWGYPEYFLRHIMGGQQHIEWTVRRFEPL